MLPTLASIIQYVHDEHEHESQVRITHTLEHHHIRIFASLSKERVRCPDFTFSRRFHKIKEQRNWKARSQDEHVGWVSCRRGRGCWDCLGRPCGNLRSVSNSRTTPFPPLPVSCQCELLVCVYECFHGMICVVESFSLCRSHSTQRRTRELASCS